MLTAEIVALLVAAAAVAGFVDSIAGGGGLITVPALMLAGMPPDQALATNKVQGSFGAATAAASYARSGLVDLRAQLPVAALAFCGGVAGALMVSAIPTGALRVILPVVLVAIALFFALKPGLDDTDRAARLSRGAFALTAVPVVAFYDGLIGPGAGAFYMLSFVMLAGFGILRATAHTKLLNLASNMGGLTAFALTGQPLWLVGLVMGAAQMAGAWAGSRVAMRIGARVIKPLLVVTSTALALRLLWQMI
ncbi:TSUP family transporter [Paracoccus luteus]|uniref:TSUP family transporter n=1 Tax=Paracoccus luteus TaxID=2508543 RepID=UPI00107023A9|nr:TSUP family transporter [Paracoccus luteus]